MPAGPAALTDVEWRLLALLRRMPFGKVTITKQHDKIVLIDRHESFKPEQLTDQGAD